MAHKLTQDIPHVVKTTSRYKLPDINGKFGIAVFIGNKELFIGFTIAPVDVEQVTKRRFIQTPKATVKTFGFDPLSE